MKKVFVLLSVACGLVLTACSPNTNYNISPEELQEHISYLASEELEGRYPATKGDSLAAGYIVEQLNNYQLELYQSSGRQYFQIYTNIIPGDSNFLKFEENGYTFREDFMPMSFSGNKAVSATPVFLGYGFKLTEENLEWNDFQEVDLVNKWAIILLGNPEPDNLDAPWISQSSARSKALRARDAGAAGVLFVAGPSFDSADEFPTLKNPEGSMDIPVIRIKRTLADKILEETGKSISKLEKELAKLHQPRSFIIGEELTAQTDLEIEKEKTANVIASLVVDPQAPYIVLGAHMDHLGYGGKGTGSRQQDTTAIHYGADDNASGVASLIEVAGKLKAMEDSLKKNFIFVAFGAEEKGLLGSKHFVNHPPVDLSNIEAMINIDMVGRLKEGRNLQVGGTGTSKEADSLIKMINADYNFSLSLSKEGYGPSDHASFYMKEIPVFFFSTGAHVDYHTPADSTGKINFEGLWDVSNYIYDLSYNLSASGMQLHFTSTGVPEMSRAYAHSRRYKVALGIMPDFSGIEKRGLRADLVIKGKPAYKSGMKNGDIITAINGKKVKGIYEYMERLKELEAGQTITVEIIRNDEKEVLLVQL